jgi:hypothetical protein
MRKIVKLHHFCGARPPCAIFVHGVCVEVSALTNHRRFCNIFHNRNLRNFRRPETYENKVHLTEVR